MQDARSLEREGPVGRNEIATVVRTELAGILEMDIADIADSATFADLNADSLALIELVEALEEAFASDGAGLRIDDEDLEGLKTVDDAVNYVAAKLGAA